MAQADFKYTVTGTYYAALGKGKTLKPFKLDVFLTEEQAKTHMSVIRNHLLPGMMPQAYPDYLRFRTFTASEGIPLTKKHHTHIETMGKEDLIAYIEHQELPIDTDLYTDPEAIREAIRLYREQPRVFETEQKTKAERQGPEIKTRRELAEMNPGFNLGGHVGPHFQPKILNDPNNLPDSDLSPQERKALKRSNKPNDGYLASQAAEQAKNRRPPRPKTSVLD